MRKENIKDYMNGNIAAILFKTWSQDEQKVGPTHA